MKPIFLGITESDIRIIINTANDATDSNAYKLYNSKPVKLLKSAIPKDGSAKWCAPKRTAVKIRSIAINLM
jgi:hypothetical protein